MATRDRPWAQTRTTLGRVRRKLRKLQHAIHTAWPRLRRFAIRRSFPVLQSVGVHIVENSYGQPIPDTRKLRRLGYHELSEMPGINMHEREQLSLLRELADRFKNEYDMLPSAPRSDRGFYLDNPMFGSVDAEMYYSIVRSVKPRRIVEIGAGFSTLLAYEAVVENRREQPEYDCEVTAIEPFPGKHLRKRPDVARLVPEELENVPLDMFGKLQRNDILFIDSSHVLTACNDVWREQLEILPRLASGVLIHVHDIFLPAHYPDRDLFEAFVFPNEQYVLQAFLIGNASFKVLLAASFLHHRYPAALQEAFSSYDRAIHLPGSFWMRKER
jgi:hypothetical protein